MPQDYINNVYDPLNPWPEARRTTRPPLESIARHIPASSTGINPVHSIPIQTAIQTQLAKGGKASRVAGRTIGEGQMYYDAAVNMLRLLDSDIPESDRANALGAIMSPLMLNLGKDLLLAKGSKGKTAQAKGVNAAKLNSATDYLQIPLGVEIANRVQAPLGKDNPSLAQVIHQAGQVIPGMPTAQNLIELASRFNVARQPWVKKLKTGFEYGNENIEDVLDEDEMLLQLARLSDNKNAPLMKSPGKFASPNKNSKTANTNAQFLNDIGKLVKLKTQIVGALQPPIEQFSSDPIGTIAKTVRPTGKPMATTPIGMGKLPTASEMRMQR
jgi:hypothetical protein